jgi:serine/threonine-protein kinase
VVEEDNRPTDVIGAVGGEEEETSTLTSDKLGPGTEIGDYVIDGDLGRGGMGRVYAATHAVIGKRAAIKVLKPDLSKDPKAVERFVLEARAVNQIGHPNIVDIYDFGVLADGRRYYVMDLLDGEPLRARLRRTGALHISEAATIIDETASALAAAHDKGIVHRDLKPDNLFMVSVPGRWPEVRLLDWGLAKLLRGATGKFQTVTGSVLGTPVYMSPEQARGETVDARTDIYALGVMAYELLTGTVPFKGRTSVDTLVAHQEEPVPPIQHRMPGLPDELAQLVEAMLGKTPDERPTLAAIRAVLKRLRGTKIPTMTAADLPLQAPITAQTPSQMGPASAELTVPRMPAPPSTVPMTLTGHVPAPRQATPLPFVYPSQPGVYPSPMVGGFPSAAGLLPPEPVTTAKPAPTRRWLVILIAAVVAIAVGVVLALLV